MYDKYNLGPTTSLNGIELDSVKAKMEDAEGYTCSNMNVLNV